MEQNMNKKHSQSQGAGRPSRDSMLRQVALFHPGFHLSGADFFEVTRVC